MQVQLNTDNNVVGSTEPSLQLEGEVHAALGRFADRITRVEVHIDLNGDNKSDGDDKRCMMEARLAGRRARQANDDAASAARSDSPSAAER